MTRFSVKVGQIEMNSINKKQLEELYDKLNEKYNHFLYKNAKVLIKAMIKKNLDYRLLLVNDEYVIVIKKNENSKIELCVGYPFPIYSKEMNESLFEGYYVRFFIRGKLLRKYQKEELINQLKRSNIVETKNFKSKKIFLNDLKQDINNFEKDISYYFDYYRFLGDSFLNTYMYDQIIANYKFKNNYFVSCNYNHLSAFYNTIKNHSENWDRIKNNSIYFMANILDVDDGYIKDFIINSGKDGLYIFISRNYYLIKKENKVIIKSLNEKEVLLINENIYDYMNRCVSPYVSKIVIKNQRIEKELKEIIVYINPYASTVDKSLSIDQTKQVINRLKLEFEDIKIMLSGGYDEQTIVNTKQILKEVNGIKIINSLDMRNLYNQLIDEKVNFIVTVDTAITHMATKMEIFNAVMYMNGFWDDYSVQSFSAESPLGFCSTNYWQLPILVSSDFEDSVIKLIDMISAIKNKKYSKKTSFDKFERLLKHIPKSKKSKLYYTARKIDVKYKLKNYISYNK